MKFKKVNFLLSITYSLYITWSHMLGDIEPFDSGVYHIPMITMIKENFILVGSGNINNLYAVNNFNFYIAALIEIIFPEMLSYYIIIPFLFLSLQFYLFNHFLCSIKNSFFDYKWIFFITTSIFFSLNPLFILSHSPDSISYCFSSYILIEVLILKKISTNNYLKYFVIFFVLVIIKISNILLFVIFINFYIINYAKLNKKKIFIAASIIIFPWILSNILISGYLIFPILPLKIINFEWSLSESIGIGKINEIKAWARFPGKDYMSSLNLPYYDWIPRWYDYFKNNNIHGSSHIIVLYSFLLYSYPLTFLIQYIYNFRIKFNINLFISLIFINSIWFQSSPDPRFSYATIVILATYLLSLKISLLLILIKFEFSNFFIYLKYSIYLFLTVTICTLLNYLQYPFYFSFVFSKYPNPTGKIVKTNSGLEILIPEDTRCWSTNKLCTYYLDYNLNRKKSIFGNYIYFIKKEK